MNRTWGKITTWLIVLETGRRSRKIARQPRSLCVEYRVWLMRETCANMSFREIAGVIGSEVISAQSLPRSRQKSKVSLPLNLVRRNTETKLIVFTNGTSRRKRLYAFNDLICALLLERSYFLLYFVEENTFLPETYLRWWGKQNIFFRSIQHPCIILLVRKKASYKMHLNQQTCLRRWVRQNIFFC